MMKLLIICLLYFVKDATMQQSCEAENQYSWSYHGPNNGPSNWSDSYPQCDKPFPSPVRIDDDDRDDVFPELSFYGFDEPVTKAKVQNLGWTVMIKPEDGVNRYLDWFDGIFYLKSIIFHFGTENDPGAEHVINGVRYPMEINYYMQTDEADFNVILSTLMNVTDDDNPAFNPITDVLPDVMYRSDSTELQSDLNLRKLLPEMIYYFYLYEGAVSNPPCEPPDTFRMILKDIGKVGKDQLDTFMSLYSVGKDDANEECHMGPNYRPSQPLGIRQIYDGPYTGGEK